MQMKRFRNGLPAALYLSSLLMASLATPGVGAEVTSDIAPPPARIERVAPREGFIWAPGYWQWKGIAYYWVSGTYIFERRGAHWIPDQWQQEGAHWQYVRGHWER